MEYRYDDGGRANAGYRGVVGDCVCRSIAIASGKSYQEVYDAMITQSKRGVRTGKWATSPRNGINTRRQWFRDYMQSLGFRWVATMGIGTGCTTHLRESELPTGKLVVFLSKHATAVIDGVIHDVYDPSRNGSRCVYGYWIMQ